MTAASAEDATLADDVDDVVLTGEAVGLELRPTPFALAAGGAIIDWIVYFLFGILFVFLAILLPLSASPLGRDQDSVGAITLGSFILILLVVPMAVELATKGKSLGRLAVGARIVRDDGGSIGFRHVFIRGMLAILDFYVTLGAVAAVVGLTNDKSKRLGDLLAGTYSQYERTREPTYPTFGVPPELGLWATTADIARIPHRLFLRAIRFLHSAHSLSATARGEVSRRLANELSRYVSPLPSVPPETFIVAVVALRRERELRAYELEEQRMKQVSAALENLPHDFPKR